MLSADIQGRIFNDLNANGLFEPGDGELGFADRRVYLDANGDGVWSGGERSELTALDGTYEFSDVGAGTHRVSQDLRVGDFQVAPLTGLGGNSHAAITTRTEHVYDVARGLLYIATTDGTIERFNIEDSQFESNFDVGVNISSLDITPDGQFLYVGEEQTGATGGMVRKVDLASGDITNIVYPHAMLEIGVRDVGITSTGKAFFTTDYNGSGWTPVREIDIENDTFSVRSELGLGLRMDSRMYRDPGRDTFLYLIANQSPGQLRIFSTETNSFTPAHSLRFGVTNSNAAVNRNGTQIAIQDGLNGLLIMDTEFNVLSDSLPETQGGIAYSATRDILYAVNVDSDEIVAYDTNNFSELYRFAIGEDVTGGFGGNVVPMHTSEDGRYLTLTTSTGVRIFDLGEPLSTTVALQANDLATVDFGNREFLYAPIARGDTALIDTPSTTPIEVLDNDQLNTHGTLTVASIDSTGTQGTVSINIDQMRVDYTPPNGFEGIDSFRYTVSDGNGGTAEAEVHLTVKPSDGTAQIRGRRWDDANENGEIDAGESMLAGATVFLDANSNLQLDNGEISTTTNAQGEYVFTGLQPGEYEVALHAPNVRQTHPVAPPSDSRLIPVEDRVAHVYDQRRDRLYIATTTGNIERFDVATGELLEPWDVGATLAGLDIDLVHDVLIVAEYETGATQGFIRRIELSTGDVTNLDYDHESLEVGAFDVAITNDSRAIITTQFSGSGWITPREIDLATNAFSVHLNTAGSGFDNQIRQDTKLGRGSGRDLFLFAEANSTRGNMFTYSVGTNSHPSAIQLNQFQDFATLTVDAVGSQLGIEVFRRGFSILDESFNTTTIFPVHRGGIGFDALKNVLYSVDHENDQLVGWGGNQFGELFRVPFGEDQPIGLHAFSSSFDGERIYFDSPLGIREFRVAEPTSHKISLTADTIVVDVDLGTHLQDVQPWAVTDTYVVAPDSSDNLLSILTNDRGNLGPAPLVEFSVSDQGVQLTQSGQDLIYSPPPGFRGTDHLTYTIVDEHGREHVGHIHIVVKPIDGNGEITGRLWNDTDGDGTFDVDEFPQPATTVFLDFNDNGQLDDGEPAQITDINGSYRFEGVAPGEYTLAMDVLDGWRQTYPLQAGAENHHIAVESPRDLVYDSHRDRVYVSTGDGNIVRINSANQTAIDSWAIGEALNGLDITVDEQWIYVTEQNLIDDAGVLYKVNLDTGVVGNVEFEDYGRGSHDVAITDRGTALVTVRRAGSGWVPLLELDLATDLFSERLDLVGSSPIDNWIRRDSLLARGADRSSVYVTESDETLGQVHLYDAASDSFPTSAQIQYFLGQRNASVSREGDFVAHQSIDRGNSVLTPDFDVVEIFKPHRGGTYFDPNRDILYFADEEHDEIVGIELATMTEIYRFDIGEQISPGRTEFAANWDYLYMTTPTGVRSFDIGKRSFHQLAVEADRIVQSQNFGIQSMETIPPRILSVELNRIADPAPLAKGPLPSTWQTQRSTIAQIEITFDEPVFPRDAAISLMNLGIDAPAELDVPFALRPEHFDWRGDTLTLQFESDELPEGVYELNIDGQVFTDLAGNTLDADGDGQGGDSFTYRGDSDNGFYLLKAEWSGDEGISVFDFTTFSYWFGVEVPRSPAFVDLNSDGGVSVFDFTYFSDNFGLGVIFPAAFAATNLSAKDDVSDTSINRESHNDANQRMNDVALLDLLNDWSGITQALEIGRRAQLKFVQ